jgi:hypothetical protein
MAITMYTIAPADLTDLNDDLGVSLDAADFVAGAIRGAFLRNTGREAFYPTPDALREALVPGHDNSNIQIVKVTFETAGRVEAIN